METRLTLGATDVSVVTISYRGDLELARDLCTSLDEFLEAGIEHVLVVPGADLELFRGFVRPGRRLLTVESVLPRGFVRLPLPHTVRLGSYRRRTREIWLGPSGPIRGWIVQQVIKMSAPSFTDREVVVFADSDIVLVAPLTADRLVRDDGVRFHRVAGGASELATHVRWHEVSARLLGLDRQGYLGADYIGNLIAWRRTTLLGLQAQLARVGDRPWHRVIVRERHVSEYMLYGVYVDLVLGAAASGHHPTSDELVHAGWSYELRTSAGIDEFLHGFRPGQVGVAIQSTEPFSVDERRAMVRACTERAAATATPQAPTP